MNQRLPVLGATFLCAALAVAGFAHAQVIEQILVKVNGEVFSKTDLETRQIIELRRRGQPIDLKSASSDQQLRKLLDDIMPQLMVDAVNEMVVVQRGKELGYVLSDAQFKGVLETIRKDNKLDTDEQFQAVLKQENLTMADLRRTLERQMIFQQVRQTQVFGRVGVTDEEARTYYDTHTNEFTTPASVSLREILIPVPTDARGTNVVADEAAKARADQARERVLAGESFEQLVAEVSDAPSRASGGLVGQLSITDLPEALARIIEPLKVGEVTPVVRTTRGYQLFKLEASTPHETMPFDQARQRISERVVTDKRKEEFEKLLGTLRAQAIIEWKNPDVKKAFDEGLKQQSAVSGQQSAVSSRQSVDVVSDDQPPDTGHAVEWYAIWTRSRHEQVVREQLEKKGIDAFLPTITRWSRWKDRKKKIDWPLFPGYCFARFDPTNALPILKCTGVVNIVSFEGKPAPIPDYELDSVRVLVASELQYDPCPMIREGMMVEVAHGPLRGVIGRLMRKDAQKARLVLSVDLIGQAVSVEVDAADVKPY